VAGTKSEIFQVFSEGVTDIQPFNLAGAREVILSVAQLGGNGWITTDQQPLGSGQAFLMEARNTQNIVLHSNDERLYFRGQGAVGQGGATLYIWVIR
jgi:hypothetical protein